MEAELISKANASRPRPSLPEAFARLGGIAGDAVSIAYYDGGRQLVESIGQTAGSSADDVCLGVGNIAHVAPADGFCIKKSRPANRGGGLFNEEVTREPTTGQRRSERCGRCTEEKPHRSLRGCNGASSLEGKRDAGVGSLAVLQELAACHSPSTAPSCQDKPRRA